MFSITVKDHVMIAHSLKGETFGPAQNMHGATFVIAATFSVASLDNDNLVINIDTASKSLQSVLQRINYQNLDEHPDFKEQNSTAEYVAYFIFKNMAQELKGKFSGGLSIALDESHIASASYHGQVN